jgi:small subunit ribosomal protein S10
MTAKTARKTASKKASKALTGLPERLRIRVRAYEHRVLDTSVKQIIDTAVRLGATVVGPVPLPTEIKKYTVNRASFIDKDSREQFEMRVHKRMIDIMSPTTRVIHGFFQ